MFFNKLNSFTHLLCNITVTNDLILLSRNKKVFGYLAQNFFIEQGEQKKIVYGAVDVA